MEHARARSSVDRKGSAVAHAGAWVKGRIQRRGHSLSESFRTVRPGAGPTLGWNRRPRQGHWSWIPDTSDLPVPWFSLAAPQALWSRNEEPEAVGAILYFFNPLFASINLKILFCREAILDSWLLWITTKYQSIIAFHSLLEIFELLLSNGFKEIKFRDIKSSQ